MENEKISVIVPIYNVEQYLNRCVNSILNQTYQNLEVLLIDDGSPDSCGDICDKYAQTDQRIRVLHKENGGLSDARNAGMELATGAYLAFIDSDDWIDPQMLEILHTTLLEHGADIAECSYRNLYSDITLEESPCTGDVTVGDNIFALEAMLDWHYFKPNAWNKLYKKKVIGNIRYPKGKIHEDEFTTYKIFYEAKKLVYIDFSFYNYDRRRTDSITGEKFSAANLDACQAFRERIDFFEANGIKHLEKKMNDIYCWQVLESAYKCYQYNIGGNKVNELIKQVQRDVAYLEKHKVDPWYLDEFKLLSKGIIKYGVERNAREGKVSLERCIKRK